MNIFCVREYKNFQYWMIACFILKKFLYYSEYIMNAKQVSSHSTAKKTGTKSAFITGKHKKHGNVYVSL